MIFVIFLLTVIRVVRGVKKAGFENFVLITKIMETAKKQILSKSFLLMLI